MMVGLYHALRILKEKAASRGSSWSASPGLLLCLFEGDVLAQLGAVLFELDLLLDGLPVLARPIDLAGLLVLELDELVL